MCPVWARMYGFSDVCGCCHHELAGLEQWKLTLSSGGWWSKIRALQGFFLWRLWGRTLLISPTFWFCQSPACRHVPAVSVCLHVAICFLLGTVVAQGPPYSRIASFLILHFNS